MQNEPVNAQTKLPTDSPAASEGVHDALIVPPTTQPRMTLPSHMWGKLVSGITMMIVVAGIIVGITAMNRSQENRSKATTSGTVLSLQPSTKIAKAGDTFALGITMNTNGDKVAAAEFHLSWDPTVIQITEFSVGTPLPVVLAPSSITSGAMTVTLGSQPASPFSGGGIIGILNIKVLKTMTSTINFTGATSVAALSTPTNTIVSTTGCTITNGPPSVTPTTSLTPPPTVIPRPTPTVTPNPPPGSDKSDRGENRRNRE